MGIHRGEFLGKCNIAEMVEKGLTLNAITNKVKIKASNENITLYNKFIEEFIKLNLNYIRNPNYKKDNDEKYWIESDQIAMPIINNKSTPPACEDTSYHIKESTEKDSNLPSESNEIKNFDKINETINNKSPAKDFNHLNITPKNTSENKSENHSVENSSSTPNSKDQNLKLNELDNNIKTLLKNVNEIKSELKSVKKVAKSSSSGKKNNSYINEVFLDEIIQVFGSFTETQNIILNSKILENIQEILKEQYNVTGDISKIVNLGLLIAILRRDE